MIWMLDTHALLWALFEPGKLGRKTRGILRNPSNEVRVSPISYWEISLKYGLGKLDLPDTDPCEIPAAALAMGLVEEPWDSEVPASFHRLPQVPQHRDPFDRLIIWHAIQCRYTLLGKDRCLRFYKDHGLQYVW